MERSSVDQHVSFAFLLALAPMFANMVPLKAEAAAADPAAGEFSCHVI
jgi:hypothetical protein